MIELRRFKKKGDIDWDNPLNGPRTDFDRLIRFEHEPVLQMRQKTRGAVISGSSQDANGNPIPIYNPQTLEWSDWQDIPLVVEE